MVDNYQSNNKRIAKNTLYLYFRMLVFLFVGLFTGRVTINALGIHDYGLLNVVGGVMGFVGYFSNLLSQGTSRFLTVGLGKGDVKALKNVFSACATIHVAVALFTLLLGETVGLWFVNTKLTIAPERVFAANYVYQISLFSAFLGIIQTPYIACVTSHEKMSTFAFMSIVDVGIKLVIVSLLLYVDTDKLLLYSTFYFVVNILMFFMYRIYCLRQFEECNMHLRWDGPLYKEIWNYVNWNAIGTFAFMANGQGITIMLNIFFSTVVNAARGIATTVSNHVSGFVMNFQTAARPQIMKYYATGDFEQMNHLVCNVAKYSSYLFILFGLPVFIETEFLIWLWLGRVPEYVVPFVRITLVELFFRSIDFPVGAGIHAFGKMKLPNLTSSLAYLSVLPLTYMFLFWGASPIVAYVVACVSFPFALFCDLWILNKYSGFNVKQYLFQIPLKSICLILASASVPCIIVFNLPLGWSRFFASISTCLLCAGLLIYYLGLSRNMRQKVLNKIMDAVHFPRH